MTDKMEDQSILERMPYFISLNYKRALQEEDPYLRLKQIINTYDLGLRALTIGMVSQYLDRDREELRDPQLDALLMQEFKTLNIDNCTLLLFSMLRAYQGNRDLLFMPELYDFYWDTSRIPHERRVDREQAFIRLTQLAVGCLTRQTLPKSDEELRKRGDEALDLLRDILGMTSFFAEYTIIRVLHFDKDFYDFELYQGLNVTICRAPTPQSPTFHEGWFYLRRRDDDFLRLHPLLIFWDVANLGGIATDDRDVGIYSRFRINHLEYLLTAAGKTVEDIDGIAGFLAMIFETIRDFKRSLHTETLTWWQLRDLCNSISRHRFSNTWKRFSDQLYLQRDTQRRFVDAFLSSSSRGMVIIGSSGVGKSSFLLALAKDLAETRSDISVLLYDGGNIDADMPITNQISIDFDERLLLSNHRIENIWHEITKINDIENRLVVVCIDAVNENINATRLLRQLDALIQSPWKWLKVIFTSRPEAWHTIKRGIKLAESLYFDGAVQEIADRSLADGVALRMEPFSRHELSLAYTRYQQQFHLKTDYGELRPDVRELLRDPFSLWLVSKWFAGHPIPPRIRQVDLVQNYLDAAVETERLYREDLWFLERSLLPMLHATHGWRNEITEDDIVAAGDELYYQIYSDRLLDNGRRANESFRRLIDNDIIVQMGKGAEHVIKFKFERFYEYFVGKEMLKRIKMQTRSIVEYKTWFVQLRQTPYLWGGIKYCLVCQFQSFSTREIQYMCRDMLKLADHRVHELIAAALIEYARDDREKVAEIITSSLQVSKKDVRSEGASDDFIAWKSLCISIATDLGNIHALQLALTHPSSTIRAIALRHAYLYYCRDHQAGMALLRSLTNITQRWFGLPAREQIESLIGLSLLVYFDSFAHEETVTALRSLWHSSIERILRIDPRRIDISGGLGNLARSIIVDIVTGFIVRMLRLIPSESLSLGPIELFFQADKGLSRRRQMARVLTSYMDEAKDVRELRDLLLSLADERDIVLALIAANMLKRHAVLQPDITIPIVRDVVTRALDVNPPGPFGHQLLFHALVVEGFLSTEARQTYLELTLLFYDRYQGRWESRKSKHVHYSFDLISLAESDAYSDPEISPSAQARIQEMIQCKDIPRLAHFIRAELGVFAINRRWLNYIFSTLELLVDLQVSVVREAIIDQLARMRAYYPYEVEDFLERHAVSETMFRDIMTRISTESIGDIINTRLVYFWNKAIIEQGSAEAWQKICWIAAELAVSRNFEQWLSKLIKISINEVYGKKIFRDTPI